MRPRIYRGSILAALAALVILLLGAALMSLDSGGITSGFRDLQHALFSRLQPNASAPAPAGDLTPLNMAAPDTGIWASNAAAVWPELLYLLIAGGILVYLLARFRPLWAGLFTVLAIAAAVAGSWYLFARGQMFLEVFMPVLVLALAAIVGAIVHGLVQPRKVVAVRSEAPAVAAEAAPGLTAIPRVPAQARTVSYLVCELRGFAQAEGAPLDADGHLTLIDSVTGPLTAAVHQESGTLAYHAGSRIAAVWNGPVADPDHAVHACETALRMMNGFTQLKDQHGEGTPYEPLQLCIGIATGPATIGGLADGHGAYAVLGDCVERAGMLSKLSLRYGPPILADEETQRIAEENFALLEIDSIAAEPHGKPMKIYAVYGNALVRASPKFRALAACQDHLFNAMRAQRWGDARTLLEQCRGLSGAIPQLYDLQLARIAWYESHPLPPDWDGAFRAPIA